ncbi:MAG: hypothetical protein ABWZ19_01690 [Hyphomicrobium sp.]
MSIDRGMPKEISQVFARRARLSSKAIVVAIVLTMAALAAIAVASRKEIQSSVKEFDPVIRMPAETGSILVPVVDR